MDTIFFPVQQTWFLAISLLVITLGGLFSERSGVISIALEGIILIGALCGTGFIHIFSHAMSPQLLLLRAVLVIGAADIVFSLFHTFAAVHMKADRVISGAALNAFVSAFCTFIARIFQQTQQIQPENMFRVESVPVLGSIPIIGDLLFKDIYVTAYIGLLLLVLAWVIIYKTRFGLRLCACEKLPQAVNSVGISVYKMRYVGTLISGLLAGIGGLIFIAPTSNVFNAGVVGYGFLALAVLIFGQWKPFRIFFAVLFFDFMKTVAATSSGIPFLTGLNIPPHIYRIVPYIATLIVLAFVSKSSVASAAEGEPLGKGKH